MISMISKNDMSRILVCGVNVKHSKIFNMYESSLARKSCSFEYFMIIVDVKYPFILFSLFLETL